MRTTFFFLLLLLALPGMTQPPAACALSFGTNMSGLADYGTELPFVNLMHNARTWYTRDIDNDDAPFDSGHAAALSYRPDGYPTHIPQEVAESGYQQRVATIWAITTGWPTGQYTVLWEGSGELAFWGTYGSLTQTDDHRAIFDFPNTVDGVFEITITRSELEDPIRNIRVLMPGTEFTYEAEPFYEPWIEKVRLFPAVRFMDWGQTNNWAQTDGWEHPERAPWSERSQMDHYTWAYEKGIPYEMMIKLMNDYDLEGWVCVPHQASDEYIQEMATLFKNELEPDRTLTVEYSNEIWNWIFGQTHWLNQYGCLDTGTPWPEGLVPYVQNCLDIWSEVYAEELPRINRVAGVFTGWLDVSQRMVQNLTPGSFDAIAPTYYFGLTEAADAELDALGESATVADIAHFARIGMAESRNYIQEHKTELADPLGVPMMFYEGGQHLTPHPFGVEPTYAQALLDIQRDTAMYNLYNEWFAMLTEFQSGDEPLQLMNFSLVSGRSARYGSWGILESIHQDIDLVPAPKFSAIMDYIANCDQTVATDDLTGWSSVIQLAPNPAQDNSQLSRLPAKSQVSLHNQLGQFIWEVSEREGTVQINLANMPQGLYYLTIQHPGQQQALTKKLIKH